MKTKQIIEPNVNNLNESQTTTPLDYSLPNLDKKQVEMAREIIIKKLQVFIQQLKNKGQPLVEDREDSDNLSFEIQEIEDCFSQMEQNLLIVENEPFYCLEWKLLVPLTEADHGKNFFGRSFNVRKLDLIESVINRCFGSTICNVSFNPTMTPINNHVPGRIHIDRINQIIEMYSVPVTSQVEYEENKIPSDRPLMRDDIYNNTVAIATRGINVEEPRNPSPRFFSSRLEEKQESQSLDFAHHSTEMIILTACIAVIDWAYLIFILLNSLTESCCVNDEEHSRSYGRL